MPISYYNPKQAIRLSAYADTIVLEPDGREQHLRAIRFGGYPEMVRAMSDAIYAGATLETEFADETAMLTCEPKKYECHLSHDGIYAEATILSLDDADETRSTNEEEMGGQTNVELPPRKCVLFCPAGDRKALFEALDRKTSVPLIPEFQEYVLTELQQREILRPLRVISIRERLEAWLLLCKKDDANIAAVLEDSLKNGAICIPGTVQNPHGFDGVYSVTGYLSAFGVTVAERIRSQFRPLYDPAVEPLSPEILHINDYIRAHAGYSLYPAQLAVAESVKRKLSEGKSAFIVAECGSGKTKIGATALAVYQAQKRKKTFNIILCPSHVAKKWVRELAETLPDTAGVIVRSITELDSLYAQYRQGDKSIYGRGCAERRACGRVLVQPDAASGMPEGAERNAYRGAAQGRYCKLLCKRCALCVSRRRERPQRTAGNALVARRHGGHGGDGHGSVYKSAGPAGSLRAAPRGAVDSGHPVLSMYLEPAIQGCGRLSAGLDETKDGLKKGIAYDKYYKFSGHPWRRQRRPTFSAGQIPLFLACQHSGGEGGTGAALRGSEHSVFRQQANFCVGCVPFRNGRYQRPDHGKNPGAHHIYAVYCRDNAHTEDVYSRELVKETLNQRTNQYEKLANIFYDRRDNQFGYDNIGFDADIDPLNYCRRAEELFELYQVCANRRQIETICLSYLRMLEATKVSSTGHLYFIPRQHMDKVDTFETFIE